MNKILTLESFQRQGGSPTYALLRKNWPFWEEEFRTPQGLADSPVAYAEVNHGRWIVNCPLPDPSQLDKKCHGAQMASRAEPRFFCVDCLHRYEPTVRSKWLRVVWPDEGMQKEIEAALSPRPVKKMNWLPNETAMQLRAENAAFLSEDNWIGKVFED